MVFFVFLSTADFNSRDKWFDSNLTWDLRLLLPSTTKKSLDHDNNEPFFGCGFVDAWISLLWALHNRWKKNWKHLLRYWQIVRIIIPKWRFFRCSESPETRRIKNYYVYNWDITIAPKKQRGKQFEKKATEKMPTMLCRNVKWQYLTRCWLRQLWKLCWGWCNSSRIWICKG